jgi:hypothetical protein
MALVMLICKNKNFSFSSMCFFLLLQKSLGYISLVAEVECHHREDVCSTAHGLGYVDLQK